MCITKQKIGDLAQRSHAPCLQGSKSVAIAMEIMAIHNVDIIGVECKDDFAGVFSRDCFTKSVVRQNLVPTETLLYEAMYMNPPTIDANSTVKEAYEAMLSYQWEYMPVLDGNNHLGGIVSLRDLAKEVIHSFEDAKIENEMILNYIQGGESYAIADYVFPPRHDMPLK